MGLKRSRVAVMLEIAGGSALAFGVGLLAAWAGIALAGLLLILFGMALERLDP